MPEISKRIIKNIKIKRAVDQENYTLAYSLLDTPVLRETKGELSDYLIDKGKNPLDYFPGDIPEYAFYKSKKVKTLVIPAKFHGIGEHAFEKSSLESVTIPSGITVSQNSFLDSALSSVTLYGDLKQKNQTKQKESFLTFAPHLEEAVLLGRETGRWLAGCKSLKRVLAGDGVEKVSDGAFAGCTDLEEAELSDTVTHLGSFAFEGCVSLKTIVLSENINRIGDDVFLDSSPDMNEYQNGLYLAGRTNPYYYLVTLGESYGKPVIHPDCRVIDGKALKDVVIQDIQLPSCLTAIGNGAFLNQEITGIEIPEQVHTIGDETFFGCKKLETVTMPHPDYIGTKAFMGCESLTSVEYTDEEREGEAKGLIKDYAFFGCKKLHSFSIGRNINRIYSSVFRECESLASVLIPSSVKVLGHRAFYMCKGLHEVILESKDTDIVDESVFAETAVTKLKYNG